MLELNKSEIHNSTVKRKAIPLQVWTGPEGFRRVEAPRFQDKSVVSPTHRPHLHPGYIPVRG